jgi:hypothetical protein
MQPAVLQLIIPNWLSHTMSMKTSKAAGLVDVEEQTIHSLPDDL